MKHKVTDYKKYIKDSSIVNPKTKCWEWQKATDIHGHAIGHYVDNSCKAHRIAYLAFVGKVADKQRILKTCGNKLCVNPEHLNANTKVIDKVKKELIKLRNNNYTHAQIAEELKISTRTVNRILQEEGIIKDLRLKVTKDMEKRVKSLYSKGQHSQDELARLFKVGQGTISRIVRV
jgi:DNA invertase Pin-like site-specific DNA recombinase